MVTMTPKIAERLVSLVFEGCRLQEFLDTVEDVIINPISFSTMKDSYYGLRSKSAVPADRLEQSPQLLEQREQYVMERMSQLRDDPILTEGGPGIPRGHILCWAMESGVSYGLVCIERDKIPLEAIDLDLVRFISRCIAHLCAVEKQQIKTVSGDQILEMLLSGKINSPVGLSSAAGDMEFKQGLSYTLVAAKLPSGRAFQVGPYIRRHIHEYLQNCWCTWNNACFTALMTLEGRPPKKNGKLAGRLRELGGTFQCPICVGRPYGNILDTKINYEYLLALPSFQAATAPTLVFSADYPECPLVYRSGLDGRQLRELCSGWYLELIQYDLQNSTNLTGTIRTYITCHFNVSQTAQALFIHPNSVLYRLNKVEALLGVDIKDAGVLHSFLFSDRLFQYTGLNS